MSAPSSGGCNTLPTRQSLDFIYHHVFLPPQVPQQDDYLPELDLALMQIAQESLGTLLSCTPSECHQGIAAATRMLSTMQKIHEDGQIGSKELLSAFNNVIQCGTPIALHVRAQNAGVLISNTGSKVRFDVFELSPTNKAAMATKGRLQRSFPGASVSVDMNDFRQPEFQKSLIHTLTSMSSHAVKSMQPTARKAGELHIEDRDTTNPAMITEVLLAFLSAVGQPVTPDPIIKNTRDEVRWESTLSPWRRSATWLLVRVALQLPLHRTAGSRSLYKEALLLLMCHIEKLALRSSFHSDELYVMNAKIAQRLLKLGNDVHELVLQHVQGVTSTVCDELTARWSTVQAQNSTQLDLSALATLDFQDDTLASLPDLDKYIAAMKKRQACRQARKAVHSYSLMQFSADKLPCLSDNEYFPDEAYAIANLHGFEEWVACHCLEWSDRRQEDSIAASTTALLELIKGYHSLGKRHYAGNPEGLSVMLLTIFELWVACDKGVVLLMPLLLKYKPGLEDSILQNLLLPCKDQLNRLALLEKYLRERSSNASHPYTKLFLEVDTPECFPVRYFDSCKEQQDTLQNIVDRANRERAEKLQEFHEKQEEYSTLMDRYSRSQCDYKTVVVDRINRFTEQRHNKHCVRCGFKRTAESIHITLHEWPLPSNGTKAKTVVFELRVPALFVTWREATLYLIKNVLGAEYSGNGKPRASYGLRSDQHLTSFRAMPAYYYRCTLLSQDKPHLGTHRKLKQVSTASDSDICVVNGLNYQYFDSSAGKFISRFVFDEEVASAYTYHLPGRSTALQQYIFRPSSAADGPSPNTVIAGQSDCPDHMTLEEFKDLASVPLGHGIQWYNLLLQFRAPTIDFKKDETALVVLQCIYQAGPSGDTDVVLRAAHSIVSNDVFAKELLDSVKGALGRIKENWESAQSLCLFSAVAGRVLSLTNSMLIQQCCIDLLRQVRNVAFDWVTLLRAKAQQADSHENRALLLSKSVDMALFCGLTFDVDHDFLLDMLGSAKNVSMLVQCSIVVQEGKQTYSRHAEPVLSLLRDRFRRLLRRTSAVLCAAPAGLDDAIQKAWPAFQPTGRWTALQGYEDHWVLTDTAILEFGETLTVHYNTLTGELLVNGLPLDRPPKEYENHAQWPVLFGESPVEVMPTLAPGMQFSLKQKYKEHEVHVGIANDSNSNDLIVRASKDNVVYTTIPTRLLDGAFPTSFVHDFVHWYNHHNGTLELRPTSEPWKRSSATMWTLEQQRDGSKWRLTKRDHAVVSLGSRTSKVVGHILRPLAELPAVHVILSPSQASIEVDIPDLQLGFSLDSGKSSLMSREFRGMSVDGDQSLTTLSGFWNKLLLKPTAIGQRRVLLAEGPITCLRSNDHVKVEVRRSSIVSVHSLLIDSLLGRLVDNGDLQCKLYVAYLHGLTSFCLPDLLTGKTGTEQCLFILCSAAVHSFDELSERNVATLAKIAKLTPGRSYYPANERVMQTVSFSSSTSFLSQHNGMVKAIQAIFQQAEASRLFYPDSITLPNSIERINDDLLERDAIRSSTFRVSGFGAEDHKSTMDVQYQARDVIQCSNRTRYAHALSSIVYLDLQTRHFAKVLPTDLLWAASKKAGSVTGTDRIQLPIIKYDPRLVASGFDFTQWLALHSAFNSSNSGAPNKFDLMMWVATVTAFKNVDLGIVQIITLMYTTPSVRAVTVPTVETCSPSVGHVLSKAQVTAIVQSGRLDLADSPEADLLAHKGEDRWDFQARRDRLFENNQNRSFEVVSDRIWRQWPSSQVSTPDFSDLTIKPSDYINISQVMTSAKIKFKACFDNMQLFEYFTQLQNAVSRLGSRPITAPTWPTCSGTLPPPCQRFVSTANILSLKAPIITEKQVALTEPTFTQIDSPQYPRLSSLIDALESSSDSAYESGYVKELHESLQCLQRGSSSRAMAVGETYTRDYLFDHQARCNDRLMHLYEQITSHIQQSSDKMSGRAVAQTAMQWPRISPILLLQMLSRHCWPELSDDWRNCIVEYGLAIVAVQRADRLVKLVKPANQEDLISEITNVGHSNWTPHQHPESLLLEIESGIVIRDVQEDIAAEMREPSTSKNAVMQLNMGEGKSSVIVPMVAASLADTSQLVRVVVAKPQSKQMFQMLVSKLGGLIGRRVRQIPFSRSLKLNSIAADSVGAFVRDCMSRGDVLLVQPEHILSFRLMVLECFDSTAKQDVGRSLLETQFFFDEFSRDIVDESDENFSTKFELIYTMGSQRQIEFSPYRWICIQQVLELVRRMGPLVAKQFPDSVELYESDTGSFPRFRILTSQAADLLVELIAKHICEFGIDGFPITRQQKSVRDAVRQYLVKFDLSDDKIQNVEGLGQGSLWESTAAKSSLLMLRGLLAGGILAFAFGHKRWRVNYGLVATRKPPSKLAVPYRAKDSPTPRSEFSHPDVVLILTSLSYYYDGLEDEDLFTAFEQLMRSDQADVEYATWVQDAPTMPHAFRQLEGINIKDRMQCILEVFPYLRSAKNVIDYFLANIVFPKAMKEFPHKLSASGWDIGMVKTHPTTGFSGTNDSKKLLPLDVNHLDLPHQRHTNALVLENVLDPRNSVCLMPTERDAFKSDAERLLELVVHQNPSTRVILDVGAQILELDNKEVAQRWLDLCSDHQVRAVIFVNDVDELSALDRGGRVELLQTSSYSSRLDECLVFLDEAHTRGTDLKLPKHYRAAVTLGANLTKDRLVQACMRMRKLGKGQTVVFCVNKEVACKIQTQTSKLPDSAIELADVLQWSISETYIDTRRAMPLWAVQGERYLNQKQKWDAIHAAGIANMSKSHAERFLEPEAQSLEDRYRPKHPQSIITQMEQSANPRMKEISARCSEFDHLQFNASTLQEEQERELSPEIEQERQIERPAQAQPAEHHLHSDVELFVSAGRIISPSSAYMPAFQALRDTTGAKSFQVSQLDGNERLLVTADFATTIVKPSSSSYASDAFQRSVQWIVVSRPRAAGSVPYLMIISPYEAQRLLPDIHKSPNVALHLYKPRCNIGYRTFDKLDFFSIPTLAATQHIPRSLLLQLDIFAGQLYLNSYDDYLEVCSFLGLATDVPQEDQIVAADGFIVKDSDGMKPGSSPVKFLQALMSKIRRNGQGIGKTDIGNILAGKLLERSHFEDRGVGPV